VTIIVMAAVARNGVIGRDGAIPWHLPADLRRFRETTMGQVLVMGRRTYESIGRPLPGRTTIVVTRQASWPGDGPVPEAVLVADSVPAALTLASTTGLEIFVQGGQQVYAEALPFADILALTWVDAEPEGDTFFPDVDWPAWQEVSREEFPGGVWSTYRRRSEGAAEKPGETL
jgi:dihydrofolate reductase